MTQSKHKRITRRGFIKGIAAGAGCITAAPYVITSNALGGNGKPAASERITVGAIGLGGRGSYVMRAFLHKKNVQVVAVSDVIGSRRNGGKAAVDKFYGNKDCRTYIDFQELLARKDIDAVMIATGDNWHSLLSIMAARAGKDIYCEKPMSVTIAESRAVADTMRRFSRIYQCGTQRRNIGHFIFAVNLARSGKLGRLHTIHAEKCWARSGVYDTILPAQPLPAREAVDWDRWLGPALWRPYNPRTYSRGFWQEHVDFSGGSITEWGSHTVDLCQWANDADATSPVEYVPVNENNDITATYANGVKLKIRKGMRFGTCPIRLEGDEGWVETGDSGEIEVYPKSLLAERKFRGGYPPDDHIKEFLDCVKSRQQPKATADVAHHSITACHAANIAVRLGRTVKWDPVKEQFINDEQANRMRSRAYRQPWRI